MAAINTKPAEIRLDQIGKAFVVVSEDVRKCLVCDDLFSRQASCEHPKVARYPYVPYVQPIGNQNSSL